MSPRFDKAHVANVNDATWVVVYTTPLLTTSYFTHFNVCSKGVGGNVSVRIFDSVTSTYTYTVMLAPVPLGSALKLIEESKIVLGSGDRIEVKSESPGVLFDVQSSYVEGVNE